MPIKSIKKGSIILARPSLNLDIFNRSVILIVEHSENGTVGFILNKPMRFKVSELIKKIKIDIPIKQGGPVEKDNLYYIHSRPDLIENSLPITEKLYWAGNIDQIQKGIENKIISENEINFYLGYCGWSPGQLANEIKNKEWELYNENSLEIFKNWTNDLWQDVLKKLGGSNLVWLNTPSDPSMN